MNRLTVFHQQTVIQMALKCRHTTSHFMIVDLLDSPCHVGYHVLLQFQVQLAIGKPVGCIQLVVEDVGEFLHQLSDLWVSLAVHMELCLGPTILAPVVTWLQSLCART